MAEIAKPESLRARGGAWFAFGSHQLHVGIADPFAPATKAHPAILIRAADLDPLAERLAAAGCAVKWDDEIPGTRRFFTADPWGNRIELVGAPGDSASAGARAPRAGPPMPCVHSFADARNRVSRSPVGRRGQGKGHRPARRAGRCRRALSGREQRRSHDRARPADVQAAPDPVGDPAQAHAVRDRERRGDRSEGADRRARRAAPAPGRHAIAADLGERAPDHAVPHDARPRRRSEARQAADRHHPAGHRPVLRRQGGPPRHSRPGPARREDPQEEDRRGARAQAAVAAPVREGPATRSADDHRGLSDLRPPHGELHRGHGAARATSSSTPARRSYSRARRARCSTSTTARIRSSPRRTRWRARRASARASGRRTSTRSGE